MNNRNQLIPKAGAWVLITKSIPTSVPVHKFAIYYAIPTGKYYWTGENDVVNRVGLSFDKDHPQTGEDMTRLIYVFGSEENAKRGLANWYRGNKHYEYTDREKGCLNSFKKKQLMEDFPVEAQIKIMTDSGGVSINADEYTIVTEEKLGEYFAMAKDGHAFVSYLSKSKTLKGKVADQVFYLRTRGISFEEALEMSIGQVTSSNLLFLYMHPAYIAQFTRDKEFTYYVNKHLTSMTTHNPELFIEYLAQVHSIEGYDDFKFELVESQNSEIKKL